MRRRPFSKITSRIYRGVALLTVATALVVVAVIFRAHARNPAGPLSPIAGLAIAVGLPVVFLGPTLWLVLGTRRLRRRLRETRFRLCPTCAQSLAGLPDEGRCTECGRAYDVWEDRKGWARERLVQPSDLDVLD